MRQEQCGRVEKVLGPVGRIMQIAGSIDRQLVEGMILKKKGWNGRSKPFSMKSAWNSRKGNGRSWPPGVGRMGTEISLKLVGSLGGRERRKGILHKKPLTSKKRKGE